MFTKPTGPNLAERFHTSVLLPHCGEQVFFSESIGLHLQLEDIRRVVRLAFLFKFEWNDAIHSGVKRNHGDVF